jgi:alpha-L-rhamnosidase
MPLDNGSDPHDASRWRAKWCWTAPRVPRPWNTYALFRKAFDLTGRPSRALVRIAADARYTLHVNGRRIHQGPARSFPHRQAFDTLDLAEHLRFGPNVIAAIVHQFGVPTAQSRYRDANGFLFDGVVEIEGADTTTPLHTPEGWLARDAKSWRQDAARLSVDLGFQEHFDADADPADWLSETFTPPPDSDWQPPAAIAPVGAHPWLAMEPRGVPLLTDDIEPFQAITAQFTGENARGYKVAPDVLALARQETRRKPKPYLEHPDALLRDDDQSATLPPPADGHFHMLVLDQGMVRTGHVIVDFSDAAGDEIIDVLYSDQLDKTSTPPLAASHLSLADRYRTRPGPQRWEPFFPKGFRYASLIFRNVEKPLKIRHLGVRAVRAAVEQAGAFECSDTTLNDIYNAAAQTLRACALDALVESPDTQSQRHAATPHAFRALAAIFGDTSLVERAIAQAALSQATDGSLHACPPADDPRGRSPIAMLRWVAALWEHYFHTGRTDLLRQCAPPLGALLGFFDAREKTDALVGGFEGFDLDIDSATVPFHRDDFSGPLNFLHLQALRHAADIYQVLKLDKDAAPLTRKANLLEASIKKHFWDPKAKAWKDGIEPPGAGNGARPEKPATVDQISVHANSLAILLRLMPETQQAIAKDVLLRAMQARRGKIVAASPLFAATVLDALVDAGLVAECLDLIRAKWSPMVADGPATLWEHWDGAGTRCFSPSAAAPAYVLPQQILGVTPTEIAWNKIRVAPHVGALDFARGTVPSPHGPIRVEWEKVAEDQLAVRVELPESMEGQFRGPLGETRDLDPGATEFHT